MTEKKKRGRTMATLTSLKVADATVLQKWTAGSLKTRATELDAAIVQCAQLHDDLVASLELVQKEFLRRAEEFKALGSGQ